MTDRHISVTGLGYVGLPVAVALGKAGFPVVAYDYSTRRVDELRRGVDRTRETTAEELAEAKLYITNDPADLKVADFHIVAVPTPITTAHRPDLDPLFGATKTVGDQIKAGDIVVYESTVYPGVTELECVPILEARSGLKCGVDFSVGYSPERINPGDREHTFDTVVKIVSGLDEKTLDIVAAVYSRVVKAGVHRAPNIKTAEAAKVIENIQRDLNISLMNELALIFELLDIDTHDVINAAGTKWNFLRFRPGLVGGHCIGVDPYYLTHRAEQVGYHPEVILAGRRINDRMGRVVARETIKRLLQSGHTGGFQIAILGITFKEDVPDCRNTRIVDIYEELLGFGAKVAVHDPVADPADVEHEYGIRLVNVADVPPSDAVIAAVGHAAFRDAGWNLISGMLKNGTGLVIDVLSMLDRKTMPEGITLWRL
ncbi:MAG: nucleotide sugar dehydrogenase [Rhodospirillales bacterium]|nr:nucleotide sugar dehydrogenase [Rhodospirillales bacterium]